MDPQGILYMKVQDYEKEVKVLIVPKALQKCVLYESHKSLGYNGTTRFYNFLKRQHYWKDLKETVLKFV